MDLVTNKVEPDVSIHHSHYFSIKVQEDNTNTNSYSQFISQISTNVIPVHVYMVHVQMK